jgi:GH35 family endo-1,4-beta-xylanase
VIALNAALACSASVGSAEDVIARLPRPEHLLGQDAAETLEPFGKRRNLLRAEVVDVADMPFNKGLEVETLDTPIYLDGVCLVAKTQRPVSKGDALFLSMYMRCTENENDIGQGILMTSMQLGPRDHVLTAEFTAGKEWKRCYVRGTAPADSGPGEAVLRMAVGFRPQKIQIANLDIMNFGKGVDVGDLPTMPLAYDGMDSNAPWRAEAHQRIEKYRKSDITINVVDKSGSPVQDGHVSVQLKRHAYGFGGAYISRVHIDNAFQVDRDVYQKHFKELFNKAVLPNALKWKQYEEKGTTWARMAYEWLSENDIPLRGHNIIWPGWNFLPPELRQYEGNPQKLRELTMERIDTLIKDWGGKIAEWDVTNEVWRQHDLMDICGEDILIQWYKRVRELDPGAKLYYNDANTLVNNQPGHQDHYYQTIKWMLEKGAPVDGMGFESHVRSFVPPDAIYRRLDRFAQLGPEIQVTEFDVGYPGASDEFLAQYARDFMTAVFSHPKTVGIVTWLGGNPLKRIEWSHRAHRPQAAFFDENWNLTPLGRVWVNLTQQEWNTNETGATDRNGTYKTRGFHGEYEVVVKSGSRVKAVTAKVGADGLDITVAI